jgi:uncharacterized protein (DUF983 family)
MATDCKTFDNFVKTQDGKTGTCTVCGVGTLFLGFDRVTIKVVHNPAGHV